MEGTENDINNFSTSSPHRLPTISASDALQEARKTSRSISTSLSSLDTRLSPATSSGVSTNGIQKGQLTEVYGPPGVGKTTFGIQIAVNVLRSFDHHNNAVWIDTGTPLIPHRVRQILSGYKVPGGTEIPSSPPVAETREQTLDRFHCLHVTSLPHLLTMFLHPPPEFPPPNTALIVIDDLSRLLLTTLPRSSARLRKVDATKTTISSGLREKLTKKAAIRKWTIISELASGMSRLAIRHDLAVVVLNQTATSVKGGRKATLLSALSAGQGWNASVGTKIGLYRDFLPQQLNGLVPERVASGLRFAEIEKVGGKDANKSRATMFYITDGGLRELDPARLPQILGPQSQQTNHFLSSPPLPPPTTSPIARRPKRKADEIADSEDEDEVVPLPTIPDVTAATAIGQVEDVEDHVTAEDGDPVEEELDSNSEPEPTPFQNVSSDAELTQDEDELDPG